MAVARGLRQQVRGWRFRSTRYVLHISDLELPDDPRLAVAETDPVEVVCHPDNPGRDGAADVGRVGRLPGPAADRLLRRPGLDLPDSALLVQGPCDCARPSA